MPVPVRSRGSRWPSRSRSRQGGLAQGRGPAGAPVCTLRKGTAGVTSVLDTGGAFLLPLGRTRACLSASSSRPGGGGPRAAALAGPRDQAQVRLRADESDGCLVHRHGVRGAPSSKLRHHPPDQAERPKGQGRTALAVQVWRGLSGNQVTRITSPSAQAFLRSARPLIDIAAVTVECVEASSRYRHRSGCRLTRKSNIHSHEGSGGVVDRGFGHGLGGYAPWLSTGRAGVGAHCQWQALASLT